MDKFGIIAAACSSLIAFNAFAALDFANRWGKRTLASAHHRALWVFALLFVIFDALAIANRLLDRFWICDVMLVGLLMLHLWRQPRGERRNPRPDDTEPVLSSASSWRLWLILSLAVAVTLLVIRRLVV